MSMLGRWITLTSVVSARIARAPVHALSQPAARPEEAAGPSPVMAGTDQVEFGRLISPLLTKYCSGCHGGETPEADVSLDLRSKGEARGIAADQGEFWGRGADELSTRRMPPARARQKPNDGERARLVGWITNDLLTADGKPDPGPFPVRRLKNRRFTNIGRELLVSRLSTRVVLEAAVSRWAPGPRRDGEYWRAFIVRS